MVNLARMVFGLALLLGVEGVGAAVDFEVSPDPIVASESCRLSYKVTGEFDGEPDFSPLEQYFDIIGRNRQTSLGWINGRREQSTSWVLSAMPRVSGRFEIPSISFGAQRSKAQTVEVVAARAGGDSNAADILLEVEASTTTPYVQQQVIYTIRLLHRVELSSPRFSALDTSTDAVVKALGDGRQYRLERSGTRYEVFEQRYAIFPQQSGLLTIKPLVLTTQVVSRKRTFFDPFSQNLQTRRVESDAIEFDVRPIPASYPAGATWLPARRVRLHEEWEPDVSALDVGTPISRTIFLWADGLIAGQLPEISVSPPAGTKLYPDQPQSSDKDSADGFTAVLQQKFAVIAGSPGSGRFEEIALPWWNIETDSLEQATLPARSFDFVGTAQPATETITASPAPAPDPRDERAEAAAPVVNAVGRWPVVAALCAAGWLVTALAWGLSAWRRQRPSRAAQTRREPDIPRGADAAKALKSACAAHDPAAAASALRAWARSIDAAEMPRVYTLRDVAQLATNAEFAAQINALDQALYGRAQAPWRGDALWSAFRLEPRRQALKPAATASPLPPLLKLAGKEH